MDTAPPSPSSPHLEWSNVGFGFAFIALDMVLSQVLQLQIGTSLVISALRCIVQLTLVATVLQSVFASQNMWTVAAIALLLNMLGTFEAVVVKAERRCRHMIPIVFLAMVVSTVPTSILGGRFAMGVNPFWTPDQYIPVLGMLCGSAIAGISVALSYVLKELEYARSSLARPKLTLLQREPGQDGDLPRVWRIALRGVPSARSRSTAPLAHASDQPNERDGHHRDTGDDVGCDPRRRGRAAGSATADDHHVHDRGVERARVHRRDAPRAQRLRGRRASHTQRAYRQAQRPCAAPHEKRRRWRHRWRCVARLDAPRRLLKAPSRGRWERQRRGARTAAWLRARNRATSREQRLRCCVVLMGARSAPPQRLELPDVASSDGYHELWMGVEITGLVQ